MTFTRLLAAAAAIATLAGTPALAQDAEAAVKARKAHMNLNAFNLTTLGGMARGNIAYDAETASTAAANLATLNRMSIGAYFPPGTAVGEIENTRALPAIWESGADVSAKMQDLRDATEAMEAAAGNGLEALQAAMGPLGGACGACHKSYRQEDN